MNLCVNQPNKVENHQSQCLKVIQWAWVWFFKARYEPNINFLGRGPESIICLPDLYLKWMNLCFNQPNKVEKHQSQCLCVIQWAWVWFFKANYEPNINSLGRGPESIICLPDLYLKWMNLCFNQPNKVEKHQSQCL